MGVFDLRCTLSGLSTSWGSSHSMLLLEERDGHWLPFTPPVSGWYARYGTIELDEPHHTPPAKFVGARIDELFKKGTLTTESKEDLSYRRKPGQRGTLLEKYLAHAGAGPFNNFAWRVGGNRVLPALFLDEVGGALYSAGTLEKRSPIEEAFFAKRTDPLARRVYVDWLLEQGRVPLAEYYRLEGERGTFGAFGKLDEAVTDLSAFELIMHWAFDRRGGLKPYGNDVAGQFTAEEEKAFAKAAWTGDEPAIAKLIEKKQPAWVEEWKAGGSAMTAVAKESKTGKAYAVSERFAIGDVVTHPTFGPGMVEELIAPNKFRARFGHEVKTLVHKRG